MQSGLQSHPPPPVPQPSPHCPSLPRLLPFLPAPLTSCLVTKATLACVPWIPALTSPAPFTADPQKPRGSTPSLLLPPTLHCSCPGQGQHGGPNWRPHPRPWSAPPPPQGIQFSRSSSQVQARPCPGPCPSPSPPPHPGWSLQPPGFRCPTQFPSNMFLQPNPCPELQTTNPTAASHSAPRPPEPETPAPT